MFKIEYLSSYTLSLRVGYCVNIEILLRLSLVQTFRAIKIMSAVMVHIEYIIYRMTSSFSPLSIKL